MLSMSAHDFSRFYSWCHPLPIGKNVNEVNVLLMPRNFNTRMVHSLGPVKQLVKIASVVGCG
jgi:hypothetical protein